MASTPVTLLATYSDLLLSGNLVLVNLKISSSAPSPSARLRLKSLPTCSDTTPRRAPRTLLARRAKRMVMGRRKCPRRRLTLWQRCYRLCGGEERRAQSWTIVIVEGRASAGLVFLCSQCTGNIACSGLEFCKTNHRCFDSRMSGLPAITFLSFIHLYPCQSFVKKMCSCVYVSSISTLFNTWQRLYNASLHRWVSNCF